MYGLLYIIPGSTEDGNQSPPENERGGKKGGEGRGGEARGAELYVFYHTNKSCEVNSQAYDCQEIRITEGLFEAG